MARPQRVAQTAPKVEEFVRPKRPVKNTEPEGPFGPWMKNPPESCTKRQKDDQGYWVEVVNCTFFCRDNKNCLVFLKINEGKKERIRNTGGV